MIFFFSYLSRQEDCLSNVRFLPTAFSWLPSPPALCLQAGAQALPLTQGLTSLGSTGAVTTWARVRVAHTEANLC